MIINDMLIVLFTFFELYFIKKIFKHIFLVFLIFSGKQPNTFFNYFSHVQSNKQTNIFSLFSFSYAVLKQNQTNFHFENTTSETSFFFSKRGAKNTNKKTLSNIPLVCYTKMLFCLA